MSSSRSNQLFRFLALCVFIVAVISPSEADPDWNCKGKTCQKGTVCEINPCKNGGRCSPDDDKDFCCLCPRGFAGKDCGQTVCDAYPCKTGVCSSSGTPYLRVCFCGITKLLLKLLGIDWPRFRCKDDYDINVAHCKINPCLNGGTCFQMAESAYCNCTSRWTGSDCSTEVASGSNSGSNSGGSNSGGSNSGGSNSGGSNSGGSNSVGTDSCTSNPCVHGSCTVSGSSYTCDCDAGFQGLNCDQVLSPTGGGSQDSQGSQGSQTSNDFCVTNPCANGKCSTSGTSYQCTCDAGWEGQDCDKQNYCYSQPCVQGTCNNGASTYTCTCQAGYVGTNCDKQDYCYPKPCVNGTCNNGDSTYSCACNAGYVGTNCSIVSGCVSNPCQNGGTCIPDNIGSFTCNCCGTWELPLCAKKDGDFKRR